MKEQKINRRDLMKIMGTAALACLLGALFPAGSLAGEAENLATSRPSENKETMLTFRPVFPLVTNPVLGTAGEDVDDHDTGLGDIQLLTLPVGLGLTKTVRWGKTPVKLRWEVHYSVVRPDDYGTEWTLQFQITPVIPNPFK